MMSNVQGTSETLEDKKTEEEMLHKEVDDESTGSDESPDHKTMSWGEEPIPDVELPLQDTTPNEQEIKTTSSSWTKYVPNAEETDIMEERMQKLILNLEKLENEQRRYNLKLVGLPERCEKEDACAFLKEWLPKALDMEVKQPLMIQQAYRLGKMSHIASHQQQGDARPRILLVKFLMCQDKDKVMEAARKKNKILFEKSQVKIFPDFSKKVQKQREKFNEVKGMLRQLKMTYGLWFPATLRIQQDGGWKRFTSPIEAKKFIENIKSSNHHDMNSGSSEE